MRAISESETSADEDTNPLYRTTSKNLHTDESSKLLVLKDRKNNDSSTIGTIEDQKTKDSD